MPSPPAKARSATGPTRTGAPRLSADWAWGGIGIGTATASAGFAAYMVVLSPPETASGNFRVFAGFDRRIHAATERPEVAAATPPATPPTTAEARIADGPAPAATAEASLVDYTPTGSVGPRRASGRPGGGDAVGPAALPLADFTLRDVFEGKALVQSRSSLSVVRPGSQLAGAGTVLSIERHGGSWVVTTDRGLIVGERR